MVDGEEGIMEGRRQVRVTYRAGYEHQTVPVTKDQFRIGYSPANDLVLPSGGGRGTQVKIGWGGEWPLLFVVSRNIYQCLTTGTEHVPGPDDNQRVHPIPITDGATFSIGHPRDDDHHVLTFQVDDDMEDVSAEAGDTTWSVNTTSNPFQLTDARQALLVALLIDVLDLPHTKIDPDIPTNAQISRMLAKADPPVPRDGRSTGWPLSEDAVRKRIEDLVLHLVTYDIHLSRDKASVFRWAKREVAPYIDQTRVPSMRAALTDTGA